MSGQIRYLNGLGLVATGNRQIADGREFDKYFKQPLHTDPFLSYAGTTQDTIKFMSDIVKNTLADTKEIAPVLRGRNLNETLKNIFDFIFKHIQYKPDDPTTEELRRPVRSWADRKTGVDCDCYSIMIGSILSNLRIPFAFRMVKINGKSHYQHVYVVVPKAGKQDNLKNRNNYYTIDPVLDTYNEEHPFTEKYDLFMQPIKYLNGAAALNGLSGSNPLQQSVYYSQEAAGTPNDNVVFFDGLDYYTRNTQLSGLGNIEGLNGLGFLTKLLSIGKNVLTKLKGSKLIKKIAKPFMFKKDGSKRKLFQKIEDRRNAKAYAQRDNTPIDLLPSNRVTSITQDNQAISQLVPNAGNLVQDIDKTISNSVSSILDNNKVFKELLETKIEANKGITANEARDIAKQTAAAERNTIQNEIMDNLDRMKTAGYGGSGMNMQNILLGLAGAGFLFTFMKQKQTA